MSIDDGDSPHDVLAAEEFGPSRPLIRRCTATRPTMSWRPRRSSSGARPGVPPRARDVARRSDRDRGAPTTCWPPRSSAMPAPPVGAASRGAGPGGGRARALVGAGAAAALALLLRHTSQISHTRDRSFAPPQTWCISVPHTITQMTHVWSNWPGASMASQFGSELRALGYTTRRWCAGWWPRGSCTASRAASTPSATPA